VPRVIRRQRRFPGKAAPLLAAANRRSICELSKLCSCDGQVFTELTVFRRMEDDYTELDKIWAGATAATIEALTDRQKPKGTSKLCEAHLKIEQRRKTSYNKSQVPDLIQGNSELHFLHYPHK
jgi:hypothetical protein